MKLTISVNLDLETLTNVYFCYLKIQRFHMAAELLNSNHEPKIKFSIITWSEAW